MVRAGSRCLSIFTNALNARVLHAHLEGPLRPGELAEKLGWAPQSSLRAAVAKMRELGALERVGDASSIGAPTELTEAGRELLPVGDALEQWLQEAPDGPVALDDVAAQGIIRVLTAGWDSTIVRGIAERPLTLIELSAGIIDVNYPALKRRLAKLRSTHLVAPVQKGNSSAYTATEWLRLAIRPLVLAGRWEHRYDSKATPISKIEVDASFLLTLPLLELPDKTTGACVLAVLTAKEQGKKRVAGVSIKLERGEIVECTMGPRVQTTWALGTVDAWLAAVIDGDRSALRISGAKPRLAEKVVEALHAALFPSETARAADKDIAL